MIIVRPPPPPQKKENPTKTESLIRNNHICRNIGEAAIHDACSSFNTTQFQSQRAVFQELVRNTMAQRYGVVGADVTDLQVRFEGPSQPLPCFC